MRILLLGCEVLTRELAEAVARSRHTIDVRLLPKGLHDLGAAAMRTRLQAEIDSAEGARYEAVVLGYALCGNGCAGLEARGTPLVLPRAHDCLALLLGSRHRYQTYFDEHPGTYFRSTGWIERAMDLDQLAQRRTGMGLTIEECIARYGDDNGRYLYEELTRYRLNYSRLAYIRTGLEPDGSFEDRARAEAAQKGWQFEILCGGLSLFHGLMEGAWDPADYLVVPPGHRVEASHDENIVRAGKASV